MLLGAKMVATGETFAMAQKLGLDPQTFYDISSVSSGQSWSMTSYCPLPGVGPKSPADNGYEGGFAVALMLKDLKLATQAAQAVDASVRSEEHTSELQPLMRISYAVFCLKKKQYLHIDTSHISDET